MQNDFIITYDSIVSVYVGMQVGKVISHYDNTGKRHFRLVVGEVKAIRLGKRKNTVEIEHFYPLDLDEVCSDMRIYEDMRSQGIMTVDTFFMANEERLKHVQKWLEWAKNRTNAELDPLLSGELEENNNEH